MAMNYYPNQVAQIKVRIDILKNDNPNIASGIGTIRYEGLGEYTILRLQAAHLNRGEVVLYMPSKISEALEQSSGARDMLYPPEMRVAYTPTKGCFNQESGTMLSLREDGTIAGTLGGCAYSGEIILRKTSAPAASLCEAQAKWVTFPYVHDTVFSEIDIETLASPVARVKPAPGTAWIKGVVSVTAKVTFRIECGCSANLKVIEKTVPIPKKQFSQNIYTTLALSNPLRQYFRFLWVADIALQIIWTDLGNNIKAWKNDVVFIVRETTEPERICSLASRK
jgi:hypothetical protein